MEEVSIFEYALNLYIDIGIDKRTAFDMAMKLIYNCKL